MNHKYTLLFGLLAFGVLPSAAQSQKQINLGGGFALDTKIPQEVSFKKLNVQFPVKYKPAEQVKFGVGQDTPQEPVYVETLCGGQADVKKTAYFQGYYVERGSECAENVYAQWLKLQDTGFEKQAQERHACESALAKGPRGPLCPVCGAAVDKHCTTAVKKDKTHLHADCQAKADFLAQARALRYKLGLKPDPAHQAAQAVSAKTQVVKALQQKEAPSAALPKAVKYQKKDTRRARAEYKRNENVARSTFKRQMGYKSSFEPDTLTLPDDTVGMARAAKKRLHSQQENMRLLKEEQAARQEAQQANLRAAKERRSNQQPQALAAPAQEDKAVQPAVAAVPSAPARPTGKAGKQARAAQKRRNEAVAQSAPEEMVAPMPQAAPARAKAKRNKIYGVAKYKVSKKDIKNFQRHYKPQMAQIEDAALSGETPAPEIAKAVEQYKALLDSYAYTKTIPGKNAYARVAAFEKAHEKDMFLIREWLNYGEDNAPAYYKALVKAYKEVHKEGNLRYDTFKY